MGAGVPCRPSDIDSSASVYSKVRDRRTEGDLKGLALRRGEKSGWRQIVFLSGSDFRLSLAFFCEAGTLVSGDVENSTPERVLHWTVAVGCLALRVRASALGSPVRGLQHRPDRARRLGNVGEQFGQRVTHRQRFAASSPLEEPRIRSLLVEDDPVHRSDVGRIQGAPRSPPRHRHLPFHRAWLLHQLSQSGLVATRITPPGIRGFQWTMHLQLQASGRSSPNQPTQGETPRVATLPERLMPPPAAARLLCHS